MTRRSPDNARTITKNSFWYMLDASAATLVMLLASVPVARVMGPDVLGHYIFLLFLTTIAQRVANVGIPATASKYIAEHLGAGELGLARAVFRVTLKHQMAMATLTTLAGCLLVNWLQQADLKLVSYLIVLSMWPWMVNNIPAQANTAAENLRANIPATFVNLVTYSVLIVLTLLLGWGLTGLATATLASRILEAVVRYAGVRRFFRDAPEARLPDDLLRRMFVFSRQNLILLVLGLVVWDRSELLFLKQYAGVREVAFYSLAFSIVNQLQMAPRAFSTSIGYTMFAQYGRDRTRLVSLMQHATRYVALVAIPIFLGMLAIADPLITLVYGSAYLAVVPVLCILSVFAIPRGFEVHSESLLQATEYQGFIVRWLSISAAVNLLLDWLLIPSYGAVGAALANGCAQLFAVSGVWWKGSAVVGVRLPWRFLRDVALAGVVMAAVVAPLGQVFAPLAALLIGIPAGALVFSGVLRLTGCLEMDDWVRFNRLVQWLPRWSRPAIGAVLRLMFRDRKGPALGLPV